MDLNIVSQLKRIKEQVDEDLRTKFEAGERINILFSSCGNK